MKDGATLVNDYGLTVLVPVVALVFSSSTLGDLVDDKTLVYIWLRPVNRLTVAAAAARRGRDHLPARRDRAAGDQRRSHRRGPGPDRRHRGGRRRSA